jgi:Glycosyl transferase family 2
MDTIKTGFVGAAEAAGVHLPLVTIVIVNHNYGAFVGQCIQSVDQQDYPNLQCIVLECASSDDSLAVIEEAMGQAKSSQFQLIRRDVNHGHLINSTTVLDDIKGAFVAYVDADDFLFPEFVSIHVKAHLNGLNSAAISVTDLIQVDTAGQVLAGTCHWHQKWRAFEQGSAWADLTRSGRRVTGLPFPIGKMDTPRLFHVPAWWSSWVPERWIWSATSGLMFRRSVIEGLTPTQEQLSKLQPNFGVDAYFARIAHSAGGSLLIGGAQGAYRRHGKNIYSHYQILGGQTPSGSNSDIGAFRDIQRLARETLTRKHRELASRFGHDLYYSMAWQLMSNHEFLEFAREHGEDPATWEKMRSIQQTALA